MYKNVSKKVKKHAGTLQTQALQTVGWAQWVLSKNWISIFGNSEKLKEESEMWLYFS